MYRICKRMYILPFIIIALCKYTSIAGCCGDDKVVDLDINIKVGTNKFKVTSKEVDGMVVYKIKLKKGYKVRLITDGNKIVYEPMKDEKFKYLEAKYSNLNDNEVILATLHFSLGLCRGNYGVNYFLLPEGWNKMGNGFCKYIINKIKNGEYINRERVVKEYYDMLEHAKRKIDIDVSKGSPISHDVTVEKHTEGCIHTNLYKVNDNVVIGRVKAGNNPIWNLKREEGFFGCYAMRVYYLEDTPELLILTIKDSRGSFELYYNRDDNNRYSSIKKSEFVDRLNELNERSMRMKELLKKKVEVDVTYNLIVVDANKTTRGQGKVRDLDGMSTRIINASYDSIIYKVTDGQRLVWKRDGEGIYGCYSVKVYYLNKSPELLVLNVNTSEGFKDLYLKKDGNKFSEVSTDDFYNRLKELDDSTNQKRQ